MTATTATTTRHGFTVTTEVDVSIDGEELADAGFHHEDDCRAPAVDPEVADAARTAHQLLGHRLADVAACGQEPCVSLPLDAVLPTMSRR